MQSVSFTPASADYVFVHQHVRAHLLDPGLAGQLLSGLFLVGTMSGVFGAVGVFTSTVTRHEVYFSELRMVGLAASAGFLALLTWSYVRQALIRRLAAAQHKDLLIPTEVQLTAANLTLLNPGKTASFDWQTFHRVKEVDGYLLFYTSVDSALFVPAHAFPSPETFSDFVKVALAQHANSHASLAAQQKGPTT